MKNHTRPQLAQAGITLFVALWCATPCAAQTRFGAGGVRHLPSGTPAPVRQAVDVDADGDLDLLLSRQRILLNDGAARFRSVPSPVLQPGTPFVAADFDLDGDADLVRVERLSIGFLTQGVLRYQSQFAPLTFGALSAANFPNFPDDVSVQQVAASDMDGDGDPDLVIDVNRDRPAVLLNDGSGQFTFAEPLSTQATSFSLGVPGSALCVRDLNDDSTPDVVLGDTNGCRVFANVGAGVLELRDTVAPGVHVRYVIATDAFPGGPLDLVLATVGPFSNQLELSLWFGASDLTGFLFSSRFAGLDRFRDSIERGQLFTIDVDADGDDEVYLGDGVILDPEFPSRMQRVASVGPFSTEGVAADLDGDGRQDLCVDGEAIWLNASEGADVVLRNISRTGSPVPLPTDAQDVDGDGDDDVLGVGEDNDLAVYRQGGYGTFAMSSLDLPYTSAARFVDIDGDGDFDVASAFGMRINDGAGSFSAPFATRLPVGLDPALTFALESEDLDGDGFDDLVFGGFGIAWNNGSGFFSQSTLLPGLERVRVRVVDLEGDGMLEIVGDRIFTQTAPRAFSDDSENRRPPGLMEPMLLAAGAFEAADLDGDGFADLIDGAGRVYANDGTGFFPSVSANLPEGGGSFVDFDGDGDLDLVGVLSVFDNAGGFVFNVISEPGSSFGSVIGRPVFVDLDDDGDLDIAVSRRVGLNLLTQLVAPFVARPGSDFELAIEFATATAASPRTVAFLVGVAPAELPLFDWGELRIDPAALVPLGGVANLVAGELSATISFDIPSVVPSGLVLYTQALVLQDGALRLTNALAEPVR